MPRRRRRSRAGCILALGLTVGWTVAVGARQAAACGGGGTAALTALPPTGAADVPPTSSIVVIGDPLRVPTGLTLEVGGVTASLPSLQPIGSGMVRGQAAGFFRLPGPLTPSTTYVLRATDPSQAAPRELTRFTTAATYDKPMGVPARIDRLRLWRVRYPVAQISAGSCVFDQYHGYLEVGYQDGTVPGTPSAEVIGTLWLVPENGSFPQTFVFTGGRFEGHVPPIPEGGIPQPQSATWRPELVPDRRYCVTLQQEGRNDLAQLPLRSNTVCAEVISLDLSGGDVGGRDSGLADAGADQLAVEGGPSDGAGVSDAAPVIGAPTDAEQRGGGYTEREGRSGCAFAGQRSQGSGLGRSLVIVALVMPWLWRRRRRSR